MKKTNLFKLNALLAVIPMGNTGYAQKVETVEKPNIIFIFTDQQHARMMSYAGNQYVKTPAMDYIAENGIRFTRAYTTNPVCVPARISMITGRFCGAFSDKKGKQVRENGGGMDISSISDEVQNTTLPAFLKKAGYDLFYGGKKHLPAPLNPQVLGFNIITDDQREGLADEAAKFIKRKYDKPYYLALSFINPHDICYMALRDFTTSEQEKKMMAKSRNEFSALDKALQIPEGVTKEEFFAKYCPPLPPNFEPQQDEPQAVKKLLEIRDFRVRARNGYSDYDWRMHRWAYCRLTEQVDKQIQIVLDALKESGQEENTLIIFSSDHGDMDGAHRMEHKTVLYEESVGVPFMAMWKGHIPAGKVDECHLVSNGLDLLPTVCDYAGIKAVADPRGKSLRPLFEGKNVKWRKTLGVETEIGRMVVSEDKLKYIKYDAVGIEEQLIDLKSDPFEMKYFTNDLNYKKKLTKLRKSFELEWFPGF